MSDNNPVLIAKIAKRAIEFRKWLDMLPAADRAQIEATLAGPTKRATIAPGITVPTGKRGKA